MDAKFKTCPSWTAPQSMHKAEVLTDSGVSYVVLFDSWSGSVRSGVKQDGRLVRIK